MQEIDKATSAFLSLTLMAKQPTPVACARAVDTFASGWRKAKSPRSCVNPPLSTHHSSRSREAEKTCIQAGHGLFTVSTAVNGQLNRVLPGGAQQRDAAFGVLCHMVGANASVQYKRSLVDVTNDEAVRVLLLADAITELRYNGGPSGGEPASQQRIDGLAGNGNQCCTSTSAVRL